MFDFKRENHSNQNRNVLEKELYTDTIPIIAIDFQCLTLFLRIELSGLENLNSVTKRYHNKV